MPAGWRQARVLWEMPRAPSHRATWRASPADSRRRPWSTPRPTTSPPRARAQRSSSKVKAKLSAPPETPTAIRGWSSNGPTAVISRANSAAPRGAGGAGSAAGVAALLFPEAIGHAVRRARELLRQLGEGDAGVRRLAQLAQGHSQLQEIVRRLAVIRVLLIALGEGHRRLLVAPAHIIGLAEPVLRIARQIVRRMLGQEGAEGLLRIVVFRLAQQVEGVFVLRLHRIPRQFVSGAGRGHRARGPSGRGSGGAGRRLDIRRLELALGQAPQRLGRERGLPERLLGAGRRRLLRLLRGLCRGLRGSGGSRLAAGLAVLELAEAEIVVPGHLVHALGELLDAVAKLFDLAGQAAHLGFELLQPDLLARGHVAPRKI